MLILKQAGGVSLDRTNVKDDAELAGFLIELKQDVLNCYSTVTTSAKDANMQQTILNYSPDIFRFLEASI